MRIWALYLLVEPRQNFHTECPKYKRYKFHMTVSFFKIMYY